MYFPGSTLQQIEDLRKRVAALEKPQTATDRNEYQNQTSASSGTGQSSYGVVSAAQGEQDRRIGEQARVSKEMLISSPVDILKKRTSTYEVAFVNAAAGNARIEADSFSFGDGFVTFHGFTGPKAAYPTITVSSITKL